MRGEEEGATRGKGQGGLGFEQQVQEKSKYSAFFFFAQWPQPEKANNSCWEKNKYFNEKRVNSTEYRERLCMKRKTGYKITQKQKKKKKNI